MKEYHAKMTEYVNAKEEARLCQIPLILLDNTEGWPQTSQDRPRKPGTAKRVPWGGMTQDEKREAKRAKRRKEPLPCRDCGERPRLMKKVRCWQCDQDAQIRNDARDRKRKR
jgi:hypothetical protein